jgi:hypothetical protein
MKEFMICDNIKNITRANHTKKAICVQDEHLMSQHAPNMIVTTAHRMIPVGGYASMPWCEGLLAVWGTMNGVRDCWLYRLL